MLPSYDFVFRSLSSAFFRVVLGSLGYVSSLKQGPLPSSVHAGREDLAWRGRAFSVPPRFNVSAYSRFADLVGAFAWFSHLRSALF